MRGGWFPAKGEGERVSQTLAALPSENKHVGAMGAISRWRETGRVRLMDAKWLEEICDYNAPDADTHLVLLVVKKS